MRRDRREVGSGFVADVAGRGRPPAVAIALAALAVVAASGAVAAGAGRGARGTVSREHSVGHDLFVKIWTPAETGPDRPGGDGLGPLYNADSCVACHHQGGVGGSGANDRNVTILAAFAGTPGLPADVFLFKGELEDLHPGFRGRSSVVLHRESTSAADKDRLVKIRNYQTAQTRDDLIALARTERSTPALFGAGLIDAVHDDVLVEAERRKYPGSPEISGRVARLKDGRFGRFGWKGQTARLDDFVLAACSNELGLEVPGHHQASLASAKEFDPAKLGLDLDRADCNGLTSFVRSLPRPAFRPVDPIAPFAGRAVFEAIGCATCHTPTLGPVDGLYSDLLLHDLGDRFRDSGSGYGGSESPGRVVDKSGGTGDGEGRPQPTGEAAPTEWRTAPLWGVAASAPYLHDGRARTLDEAILLHGGEAARSAARYARLGREERSALIALLRSLTAPAPPPGRNRPRGMGIGLDSRPTPAGGMAAAGRPAGCCNFL